MGTAGMPPPEAVLTELVIMTLLAAVAETHHTLGVAVGALDRVKDCGGDDKHTHVDGVCAKKNPAILGAYLDDRRINQSRARDR